MPQLFVWHHLQRVPVVPASEICLTSSKIVELLGISGDERGIGEGMHILCAGAWNSSSSVLVST